MAWKRTLETFLPWTLVRRGLKKQVITPLDAPQEFLGEARREQQVREMAQDTPLMRALGLAHQWQRLLDEGRFSSMTEIAAAEGIDLGQASKMSRLVQLAPDLIEAIALRRLEVGVSQLLRGKLSASWLWLNVRHWWQARADIRAAPTRRRKAVFFAPFAVSVARARAIEEANPSPVNPRQLTTLGLECSRGQQRTERERLREARMERRLPQERAQDAKARNRANTGGTGKKNPNRIRVGISHYGGGAAPCTKRLLKVRNRSAAGCFEPLRTQSKSLQD
jgi:hypothetical protein